MKRRLIYEIDQIYDRIRIKKKSIDLSEVIVQKIEKEDKNYKNYYKKAISFDKTRMCYPRGYCIYDLNLLPFFCEIYVIWYQKEVVGLIELAVQNSRIKEKNYAVSIVVKRCYRKNHIASQAMNLLIEELKKEGKCQNLIAQIKPYNTPSRKLFESLNFSLVSSYKENTVYEKKI